MALRTNRAKLRLVEVGSAADRKDGAPPREDAPLPPTPTPTPSAVTPPPIGRATVPSGSSEAADTPIPGLDGGADRLGEAQASAARGARASAATRAQLNALQDAQLVALGCKGEVQALEILYRRHAAFAIHLAARIVGSARDVEDIAHDAFLRAFERIHDLADRTAFRSWLGAIVVHAVRSRMRRARLMSVLGMGKASEPVDLDAIASPDASPHTRAQIAQIYALLRTLPTDDRIAWTLRAVEGHDLETVARLTRCSLATVKRRITRAQRFLDEHFVEGDDLPSCGTPESVP